MVIQPSEDQFVEARGIEPTTLAVPDGEQDDDPLGSNAPSREHERVGGGSIQPLGVVDDAQERTLFGRFGEQREHAGGHQEAIRARGGYQAETGGQRLALGHGQPREQPDDRPHQAMQPSEVDV